MRALALVVLAVYIAALISIASHRPDAMAIAPHPNAEPGAYVTDGWRLLYVRAYERGDVVLEDCIVRADFDQVVIRMSITRISTLRLVRPAPDRELASAA